MSSRQLRGVCLAVGLVVAAAGVAGVVYSVRSAMAQNAYYRLKYGVLAAMPPEQQEPVAVVANRRYRHNYYLSMLLAESFWNGRHTDDRPLSRQRVASAARWCGRGLEQNPYRRELRWLDALLIGLESPAKACERWQAYVDFAFWDAWNIASLVVLRAEMGNMEGAMELLPLLHGKPTYPWAWKALEAAAWRQRRPPPLP